MMTTTIDRKRPVPASSASQPVRFAPIRANLMPAEIISGRRAEVVRRRVLLGLATLVVVLMGVYGLSWWQTHAARNDLATARDRGAALQGQTREFAPLVSAQASITSIDGQLRKLTVGDLSWADMLTTLRSKAPAGVQLTQIGGTVTSGAAQAAGGGSTGTYDVLNQSGQQQVGTMTLTGTARDQRAVANYADTLAAVKGLASPFVTSVTSGSAAGGAPGSGGVTFNITVLVTAQALGGRYVGTSGGTSGDAGATAQSSTTGGK